MAPLQAARVRRPLRRAPISTEPASGWQGRLELGFAPRGDRTALVRRAHSGPLMVQSPFYPEGHVCHVYLLHPPGGVVGGDGLRLCGTVHEGGHALLTTPAATKIYRSAGDVSHMDQDLHVAPGASLEWLPQETLVFSGARARMATRVHLRGSARFIGWEAMCLGRPASGERFEQGAMRQDVELWKDGQPLLIERNAFAASSALMRAAFGLAGHGVLASLLLYPSEEHLLPAARALLDGYASGRAAATEVDGVLVCRVIGDDMLAVRGLLQALWRGLRPLLLGRAAVAPRIWAT